MKDKQLLPGRENLKGPIPAPAVTLGQQPHPGAAAHCPVADRREYLRARRLYIMCCAWFTLENAQQCLRWRAVSTRQAAVDGRMRGVYWAPFRMLMCERMTSVASRFVDSVPWKPLDLQIGTEMTRL
ncbi:hypothetical protein T07_12922 [Trichinella nelsoni]|uniref:Uncharacterized protein n=1 Tax=Trichinella nelsoni TaxID=6336 RepID=A0A0V0RFQ9_9BILA|nr:hypothetical protein T07_12922 [Trichinella nelsoni]